MKVLMISLDKRILDAESPTSYRIREYSSLVERLEVVVIGSYGKNKPLSFFKALRKSQTILGTETSGWIITTQDPFFTGLMGWMLKLIFKVPLQVQVHIDLFGSYFKKESLYNRMSVFIAKRILPKVDCVRVVSEKIKDDLLSLGIPENKIFVLPVFTDVEKIINYQARTDLRRKYPQFKFLMLMASRLVKQKNIDMAILSMSKIVSKYPDAGLLIIGSGPEEKRLKDLAGNMPNVAFESWSDDLVSYFKTADILLLPSFYEGFVRTAVEAMAAGCPVLMSNMILSGDIFSAGYTCLSFNLDNPDEFADKIIYAIENKESMEEIRNHALNSVKALPTKEEYLSNYLRSWQNCFL